MTTTGRPALDVERVRVVQTMLLNLLLTGHAQPMIVGLKHNRPVVTAICRGHEHEEHVVALGELARCLSLVHADAVVFASLADVTVDGYEGEHEAVVDMTLTVFGEAIFRATLVEPLADGTWAVEPRVLSGSDEVVAALTEALRAQIEAWPNREIDRLRQLGHAIVRFPWPSEIVNEPR